MRTIIATFILLSAFAASAQVTITFPVPTALQLKGLQLAAQQANEAAGTNVYTPTTWARTNIIAPLIDLYQRQLDQLGQAYLDTESAKDEKRTTLLAIKASIPTLTTNQLARILAIVNE